MTEGASYIYPALGRPANEGESGTEDGRNGREVGGNIGKGKGKCSGGVGVGGRPGARDRYGESREGGRVVKQRT